MPVLQTCFGVIVATLQHYGSGVVMALQRCADVFQHYGSGAALWWWHCGGIVVALWWQCCSIVVAVFLYGLCGLW